MITKLDRRPKLEIPSFEATSDIEKFQNQSLRPILKFQNEVYVAIFSTYVKKLKVDSSKLVQERRNLFMEQSILKNAALKNMLIGITIGLLSNEEIKFYVTESKELNKRIISMVIERLKNQI